MKNQGIKKLFTELVAQAKSESITRYVVGGIVKKGDSILLLQRSKNDFMGGIYEPPSGKVEKGETLDASLGRELFEETNLKLKKIKKYLGYFDYPSSDGTPTRQFNFEITVKGKEVKLSDHDNYAWVNIGNLESYPVTDKIKTILRHA